MSNPGSNRNKSTMKVRLIPAGVLSLLLVSLSVHCNAFAQSGTPLPGSNYPVQSTGNPAPPPAATSAIPLPGASSAYQSSGSATWAKSGQSGSAADVRSLYQFLPISADDAKVKIDELKTLILVARPQDIQGRINNLCEWLADLTDAHNKLANAFSRQECTKAMAQSEKSSAQRFTQLKNEAVLLKAELLIKLNRAPEALAPLVDIVMADPKGPVGQAAYRHLKELGFSSEPPENSGAISATNQPQEHIMIFPSEPGQIAKKGPAGKASASAKAHAHSTK